MSPRARRLPLAWMLGKRYTSTSDASLEVLVVKAGKGTLTAADTPLVFKEAKPLPASD
jgi:hypothetical protein